jgi:hypothetical protein
MPFAWSVGLAKISHHFIGSTKSIKTGTATCYELIDDNKNLSVEDLGRKIEMIEKDMRMRYKVKERW